MKTHSTFLKILLYSSVIFFTNSVVAQNNAQPQDVLYQAGRVNISLREISQALQVYDSIKAVNPANGTITQGELTNLLRDKRQENKDLAIETSLQVQELVRLTINLVNNTLATANLFSHITMAGRVVSDEEAKTLDTKTVKAEKLFKTISDLTAVIGVAGTTGLLLDNSSGNMENAIYSISASTLISKVFAILKDNKKVKNTAHYVHHKATQLSIHSFLLIKVSSVREFMLEVYNLNEENRYRIEGVNDTSRVIEPMNLVEKWTDFQKLIDISDDVLRMITMVDHLYNVELSTLQKEIKARSKYEVYTEEGRTSLEELVTSAEKARKSWKNVRYFYTEVEQTLVNFKSLSDFIKEIYQTPTTG